jgi:hypothetical protein
MPIFFWLLCGKSGSSKTANGDDQIGAGQLRPNNTTYPDYSDRNE